MLKFSIKYIRMSLYPVAGAASNIFASQTGYSGLFESTLLILSSYIVCVSLTLGIFGFTVQLIQMLLAKHHNNNNSFIENLFFLNCISKPLIKIYLDNY